jgi:hypothetical protein
MIPYATVQIVAVEKLSTESPLQAEEAKLEQAGPAVKFEFINSVIKNFGMTFRSFRQYTNERQFEMARRAYYLQAMSRAVLVYRADAELAAIINRIPSETDLKPVALDFELLYYKKFGKWPPIVPVDVDALTERMLSDLEVR